MVWKCSICQTDNEDETKYCVSCGTAKPEAQQSQSNERATGSSQETQQQPQGSPQSTQVQTAEEVKQVDSTPSQQEQATKPEPVSPPTPQPQSPPSGRYYIVLVNTPVPSLIKAKLPLDFENFPVISVGRSPENVVVIPDQEVSRRHAQFTLESDSVVVEDLNSTNGTYIYDGRVFQTVKGKVKVEPNSLIKLGSSTILKLVRE